jgi:hypothetical protein
VGERRSDGDEEDPGEPSQQERGDRASVQQEEKRG